MLMTRCFRGVTGAYISRRDFNDISISSYRIIFIQILIGNQNGIKNRVHTLLKTGTAPILLFFYFYVTRDRSAATGNDTREELVELAKRNAHRHWTVSGYCGKDTSLFQP